MERYKIIENPFGEIVLMGVPGSFENKTELQEFIDDLAEAVGAFNLRCCIGGSVWKHHPEHAEEILEWKKNGTGPMPELEEFKYRITGTQALDILRRIPRFSDAVDILRGASADVLDDENLMNALVDDIVGATRPELDVYVIELKYANRHTTIYAAAKYYEQAIDLALECVDDPDEPTVWVERIWDCEHPGVISVKNAR